MDQYLNQFYCISASCCKNDNKLHCVIEANKIWLYPQGQRLIGCHKELGLPDFCLFLDVDCKEDGAARLPRRWR